MASLTRDSRSPYWYLSFRKDGRWLKKATRFRVDDASDTLEARKLCHRASEAEWEKTDRQQAAGSESAWERWVDDFLVRHCSTEQTLGRYRGHWKIVSHWLQLRGFHGPADLTYKLALEYMEWRTTVKKRTGKLAGWNTARHDLKVLSLALTEATRIGFIAANPLAKLGFKKKEAQKKPKLDDEAIQRLEAALVGEPEWMGVAFRIALNTGCRLRETVIPLSDVDLAAGGGIGKITFGDPKGGTKRAFSIPMPEALRPLFERLKAERRKVTLELPFQPSRRWQQFLKVHGLPGEWVFHCLRVTYINRLRQAGVPREDARRLVNHASEAVHQEYQREEFEDLLPYVNAVRFPSSVAGSAGAGTSPSPTKTPSPGKRGTRPAGKARGRPNS